MRWSRQQLRAVRRERNQGELCLFDFPDAKRESARILLPEYADFVWHGYFPDLVPGQLYG